MNLVSSVGDSERATEHTCTAAEISIWNPIIRRQVTSPNYDQLVYTKTVDSVAGVV